MVRSLRRCWLLAWLHRGLRVASRRLPGDVQKHVFDVIFVYLLALGCQSVSVLRQNIIIPYVLLLSVALLLINHML